MNNILKDIKGITKQAQDYWSETKGDYSKFPSFAQSLLSGLKFECISVNDVMDAALQNALPLQHYQNNTFSNFPICIAREQDVFLDLYFWVNSDTNIHNHSFVGAFMVIEGQVQQTAFSFEQQSAPFDWLQVGQIQNESNTVLRPGDCQEIKYLDEFIHQSLHTPEGHNITITMCLRTNEIGNLRLSSFLLPNIKLETTYLDLSCRKKLDACDFFHKLNWQQYKPLILTTIKSIDLKSRISIMAFQGIAGTPISNEILRLIEEEATREHGQEKWFQSFIMARNFMSKLRIKLSLLKN